MPEEFEAGPRHRFVFIRHARALCNEQPEGMLIDSISPDATLTAKGKEQAQQLALMLPDALTGRQVFSSPLRRAVETACPIAVARRLPLALDPRLEELRITQTLTPALSVQAWDRLLTRRLEFPEEEVLSGVEPLLTQRTRVEDFMRERHACRGGEQLTLMVSHALTIELAINVLLGMELHVLRRSRIRISNAALHVVENDQLGGQSRLVLVNAKNHLGTLL